MVLDFDYTKEYSMPMSENLKPLRIRRNPIQLGEGLICNDQLESKGLIQALEYTGGSLYIPVDAGGTGQETNAVMVAEVTVSVDLEERKVHINRIFCEYGQDDLVPALMGQVSNFADFYGCQVCISDPRQVEKLRFQAAVSSGRATAGGRI